MWYPPLSESQRSRVVRLYWSSLTAGEIAGELAGEIDIKEQTIYDLWGKARKAGKLKHKKRPIGGF